jgi:hypothetical protein
MTSRFRRPLGLKATLVGAVFLTVSATAAIVYLPWAITARRNINTIVAQVNQEMVVGTSQEVDRLFTNAQSAQQLVSRSFGQDLIDLNDLDATRDFMLGVLQAYPAFTWVQYGDAGGDFLGAQRGPGSTLYFHHRTWNAARQTTTTTIYTFDGSQGLPKEIRRETKIMDPPFYAPERPWYQAALAQPGQPVETVYVYRSNRVPGMDVTVTLSKDEEITGVIGIGIELTQLSEYLESLQKDRPGAAFIINDQQDLIASTVVQEAMPTQVSVDGLPQLQRFTAVQDPLLQRASRAIQSAPALNDLLRYTDRQSGDRYYISLTRLDYLDWTVGTIIPEADYMIGIRRNQQLLLVVIVFFTICTAAIAIGLANRLIAQPVLDIAKTATKIEDETFDVDQDLEPLAAITTRQDEIGRLARIFQQMAHQVYQREKRMKQQIQAFQIEIDQAKRQNQVKEIVETDFFQDLAIKAKALRQQQQTSDPIPTEDNDTGADTDANKPS